MKWILGLDLRAHSGGAVRFAAWLASVAPGEVLLPLHVVEEEHLLYLLHQRHLDEVLADVRAAAARALAAGGAEGRLAPPRVEQARFAEEALAAAVAEASAGALIVGRIARRGARPLVRLGRVARRLVRHLPAPLVVVPPDLAAVPPGPVVALTSRDADSAEACRFARDLARLVGRPLAILHVAPDPADAAAYGLPDAAVARHRAEVLAASRAELAAWLVTAGVEAAFAEVAVGDVVEEALAFADRHEAALVVAGARRRHSAQRLYGPSVGRELAAAAGRPVAIVPAAGT